MGGVKPLGSQAEVGWEGEVVGHWGGAGRVPVGQYCARRWKEDRLGP